MSPLPPTTTPVANKKRRLTPAFSDPMLPDVGTAGEGDLVRRAEASITSREAAVPPPAAPVSATAQRPPSADVSAKVDPLKQRLDALQGEYLEASQDARLPEHKKHRILRVAMPDVYEQHMKNVNFDALKARAVQEQVRREHSELITMATGAAGLPGPSGYNEADYNRLRGGVQELGGTVLDDQGRPRPPDELAGEFQRLHKESEKKAAQAEQFKVLLAEYRQATEQIPDAAFEVPFDEDGRPDVEKFAGLMAKLRTQVVDEGPRREIEALMMERAAKVNVTPVMRADGRPDVEATRQVVKAAEDALKREQLTQDIRSVTLNAAKGFDPPDWLRSADPTAYASAVRGAAAWQDRYNRELAAISARTEASERSGRLAELRIKAAEGTFKPSDIASMMNDLTAAEHDIQWAQEWIAHLNSSGTFFGGVDERRIATYQGLLNNAMDRQAELTQLIRAASDEVMAEASAFLGGQQPYRKGGKELSAERVQVITQEYVAFYQEQYGIAPDADTLRQVLDSYIETEGVSTADEDSDAGSPD